MSQSGINDFDKLRNIHSITMNTYFIFNVTGNMAYSSILLDQYAIVFRTKSKVINFKFCLEFGEACRSFRVDNTGTKLLDGNTASQFLLIYDFEKGSLLPAFKCLHQNYLYQHSLTFYFEDSLHERKPKKVGMRIPKFNLIVPKGLTNFPASLESYSNPSGFGQRCSFGCMPCFYSILIYSEISIQIKSEYRLKIHIIRLFQIILQENSIE